MVYSYWSRASHRFQISTVELYDASPRNLTALQLVFGGSGNATISSYRPVQLEVSSVCPCDNAVEPHARYVGDHLCRTYVALMGSSDIIKFVPYTDHY